MNQQISLCIILGNEAKHIERFIRSFAPAVNELCIVRAIGTQEPDASLEIALRVCNELGLPLKTGEYINKTPLPHTDNFGEARNQSFALATKEWRMWADCDDILEPEAVAKLKEFLATEQEADHIFCWYKLTHTAGLLRERIFRATVPEGKWHYPVHECYASKSTKKQIREDIFITHLPIEKNLRGSFGRNLTIMQEAIKDPACPPVIWFYICRDGSTSGLKELAFNAGIKALTLELSPVERYETFLLLFGLVSESPSLVDNPELARREYLLSAIQLTPWRREAIGAMACLELELDNYEHALGWMMHCQGIPEPAIKPWTHRAGWYGYQYIQMLTKCLRLCGRDGEARDIEAKVFEKGNRFISILHATARGTEALITKEKLLASAQFPLAIEYIFAVDAEDSATLKALKGERVILNHGAGPVSAWNAAAELATGEVLIQMSDDWELPPRWDQGIYDCIKDALGGERVLLVDDSNCKHILVTMAIVTRAYYARYGYLFHPEFFSMYSDNELTVRALKDGALFDCRHYLKFLHDHPLYNPAHYPDGIFSSDSLDAVYKRSNSKQNYEDGLKLYQRLHPDQPVTITEVTVPK